MKNNNMQDVKVVGYKDVGFDYDVCNEIYESGSGEEVAGRKVSVGYWKEQFEERLDWEEDEADMLESIQEMLENISNLDDDTLISFDKRYDEEEDEESMSFSDVCESYKKALSENKVEF